MRNKNNWKQSKYVFRDGVLSASRDSREVGISSRLITDLVASHYGGSLQRHASGKLLDLGCGKVPLFAAYKAFVSDNICVDWANSSHKNDYLDYELDLAQPLFFGDNEFDTIILSDVLEHLPNPELVLHEISRILAPNGKLIMNVPFYYWLHEEPHDYYRFTEFALKHLVQMAGLRLVQIHAIGGAPEVLVDIFAKNIVGLPKLGRPLAKFSQWLMSQFLKTKFGSKVSQQTRDKFPLGYFLVAEK